MNLKVIKQLRGLYAITDPELMGEHILPLAEQAILGGIKILQYRNKSASSAHQLEEATTLAKLCKKNNVIFIINDNIELSMAVNAEGVHLGQNDTSLSHARKQLGKNKIIGVSCNNQIKLAQIAQQQGADYIAFGRFFNSLTKPEAPQATLSLLAKARQTITIPIVAIGGISHETAPLLIKEGVDMLAVINSIFGQADVFSATQQFVEILNTPQTSA